MNVVGIDFFVNGGVLTADLLNAILGGDGSSIVNTPITTAGDGVLTAAALDGGLITRTGPVAAFTDTTATAAAIAALLGANLSVGETFAFTYKNSTAFPMTMAAGSGVTLASTTVVPPFGAAVFFGTMGGTQAAPTVTLTHIDTNGTNLPASLLNPKATALGGTGDGTITAAGVVAGLTTRSAQTAAHTDTTDTAVAIIAAASGLGIIGKSMTYRYINNGVFPITIAGGVGVTVSEATVVPANSWVEYLVTRDGSATLTMVAVAQGYFPKTGTTGAANGATPVTVSDARVTAGSQISLTINTPGGTVGAAFVTARTAGTGFTFNSAALNTSTYDYEIRG